ncbi:hypothetical protein KIL84_004904 [Mauremys mutica]|uniref:Uncharacterized protein n=1 Tax=Mauremys mutica TaxID=74926 RepID=A0A9D3XNX0_9SAUR|nr:hypothetical protein KIL84_004904 [Mauremys mutica]
MSPQRTKPGPPAPLHGLCPAPSLPSTVKNHCNLTVHNKALWRDGWAGASGSGTAGSWGVPRPGETSCGGSIGKLWDTSISLVNWNSTCREGLWQRKHLGFSCLSPGGEEEAAVGPV